MRFNLSCNPERRCSLSVVPANREGCRVRRRQVHFHSYTLPTPTPSWWSNYTPAIPFWRPDSAFPTPTSFITFDGEIRVRRRRVRSHSYVSPTPSRWSNHSHNFLPASDTALLTLTSFIAFASEVVKTASPPLNYL